MLVFFLVFSYVSIFPQPPTALAFELQRRSLHHRHKFGTKSAPTPLTSSFRMQFGTWQSIDLGTGWDNGKIMVMENGKYKNMHFNASLILRVNKIFFLIWIDWFVLSLSYQLSILLFSLFLWIKSLKTSFLMEIGV